MTIVMEEMEFLSQHMVANTRQMAIQELILETITAATQLLYNNFFSAFTVKTVGAFHLKGSGLISKNFTFIAPVEKSNNQTIASIRNKRCY